MPSGRRRTNTVDVCFGAKVRIMGSWVFFQSKLIHARNVRQGGGLLCACAEIKTLAAEMRAFLSPGGVRG